MNWNDYETAWKCQELPVAAPADLTGLKDTFESKRRKMAATLFARDLIEGSAGLFVSGVYARMWWLIGKDAWPLALAIALMLGVSVFFIRERIRTHCNRLGPQTPLLAKLTADITELHHQRNLLLNLWKWYLGPITGAMGIFVLTMLRIAVLRIRSETLAMLWRHPLVWGLLLFTLIAATALIWFVWKLNRRAVQKQIEPRLVELEKLRADLLSAQ